jgi:hypothetical protein
MIRGTFVVLGLLLAILFIAGVASGATPWLVWLDGFLALGTIVAAWVFPSEATLPRRLVAPLAMGTLPGLLWVIGLLSHATPWLVWWNFVLACGFALVTMIVGGSRVWGSGELSRPV